MVKNLLLQEKMNLIRGKIAVLLNDVNYVTYKFHEPSRQKTSNQ